MWDYLQPSCLSGCGPFCVCARALVCSGLSGPVLVLKNLREWSLEESAGEMFLSGAGCAESQPIFGVKVAVGCFVFFYVVDYQSQQTN